MMPLRASAISPSGRMTEPAIPLRTIVKNALLQRRDIAARRMLSRWRAAARLFTFRSPRTASLSSSVRQNWEHTRAGLCVDRAQKSGSQHDTVIMPASTDCQNASAQSFLHSNLRAKKQVILVEVSEALHIAMVTPMEPGARVCWSSRRTRRCFAV